MDVEEADIAAGRNNNSPSFDRHSDGDERLEDDDRSAESESESEPAEVEYCGGEEPSRLDRSQGSESEDGCDDVDPCQEGSEEGPQETDYGDFDDDSNSRASQDDPEAEVRVEAGHEAGGSEIDAGIYHEENVGDETADDVNNSEESDCKGEESVGIDEIPPRISDDSDHSEVADAISSAPGDIDDRLRADTDETAPLVQRPKSNSGRRRSSAVNSMEGSHVFSVYLSDHFSDEDEMERGIPGQSSAGKAFDDDSGSFYSETPKERRIKYAKAAVLVTVVWLVMVSGVSIILSIDIWGVSERFDRSDDEDLCILCGNHTLDFDFNSTSWPSLPTSNTATVVIRTLKPPPDNLPALCSPTMFLGAGTHAFGKIERCVQKCLPAACCLFHDKEAVLELVGTLGLTGDLEQQVSARLTFLFLVFMDNSFNTSWLTSSGLFIPFECERL